MATNKNNTFYPWYRKLVVVGNAAAMIIFTTGYAYSAVIQQPQHKVANIVAAVIMLPIACMAAAISGQSRRATPELKKPLKDYVVNYQAAQGYWIIMYLAYAAIAIVVFSLAPFF